VIAATVAKICPAAGTANIWMTSSVRRPVKQAVQKPWCDGFEVVDASCSFVCSSFVSCDKTPFAGQTLISCRQPLTYTLHLVPHIHIPAAQSQDTLQRLHQISMPVF